MKVISHPAKPQVKKRFNRAAEHYDNAAEVQHKTAQRLAASLNPWIDIVPPGPVLELGAGTGLLTRELMDLLAGRDVYVTDIAEQMLQSIPAELKQKAESTWNNAYWQTLDAEFLEDPAQPWSMIVHNFLIQWFKDPAYSLQRMVECLAPGGLMLAAFPGHQSFPQWQEACELADVPFTGNPMPNTEEMVIKLSTGPCEVDFYEDEIRQTFPDALGFFRSLRRLGAHTSFSDDSLSISQLRKLNEVWTDKLGGKNGISISYHVVFLAVKKHS